MYMHNPLLKLKLFDALVRPIMSYACEVWAIVGGKGAVQDKVTRYSTRTGGSFM